MKMKQSLNQNDVTVIQWAYPDPENVFDRFVGPGATRAEIALQFIPSLLILFIFLTVAVVEEWNWSLIQLGIAGILMLDAIGGVITNATSSAKRWYHREGQGFIQHMGFVFIHIVQPLLIMLFFDKGNWFFVFGSFGYLIFASILILGSPLYLRRPLAGLFLVGAFFISFYGLPVPKHFEWFLLIFYTKLLSSHLLREEPYRPLNERRS